LEATWHSKIVAGATAAQIFVCPDSLRFTAKPQRNAKDAKLKSESILIFNPQHVLAPLAFLRCLAVMDFRCEARDPMSEGDRQFD
jgi:hypothetical protein